MDAIIAAELVQHGQRLFNAPASPVLFTKDPGADALLNDLANHPHAFVLACVMDRQIKAERAWPFPTDSLKLSAGFLSSGCSKRLLRDSSDYSKACSSIDFRTR